MGSNSAYTEFEEITVGIYDLGKLDNEVLTVILEAYRGCDIDSGGSRDLVSTDGKGVEQIVIETMGGAFPVKPCVPVNWSECTIEQRIMNDEFYEAVGNQFNAITKQFGW